MSGKIRIKIEQDDGHVVREFSVSLKSESPWTDCLEQFLYLLTGMTYILPPEDRIMNAVETVHEDWLEEERKQGR